MVFDEADTLLGEVDNYNMCKELASRRLMHAQTLFFSATFTEELKTRVRTDFLKTPLNAISLVVTEKQEGVIDPDMLCQCVVDCRQSGDNGQPIGKFGALQEMYTTLDMSGGTLVFCRTRAGVDTVYQALCELGMKPCKLTGNTEKGSGPDQRNGLFKRFRDTEEFNVCICTDILGKGVDITKVSGWGAYCQASCCFLLLPVAPCCSLLLPVAPSVSCSSVDALLTRSSKFPPSSTVSCCLPLSFNVYNPSKFTPQPPSQGHHHHQLRHPG